jgi:hypothetical protein
MLIMLPQVYVGPRTGQNEIRAQEGPRLNLPKPDGNILLSSTRPFTIDEMSSLTKSDHLIGLLIISSVSIPD